MDHLFTQNLRYKLQKRVSRLNAVDDQALFFITLTQLFLFFDRQPIFMGIVETLLTKFPYIEKTVEEIFSEQGRAIYGNSEEESAAIGYLFLKRIIENTDSLFDICYKYRHTGDGSESLDAIKEIFIEPLYEYVDENLDDQRAMLALLMRYKHRCEWFHKAKLWDCSNIERQAEKLLSLDLYSYLYDQGIDFMIEPSSITGEIDLISAQNSDDPLLLDAKVFDGDGRGKSYGGFNSLVQQVD